MIFVVRENLRGLRLAHATAIPRRITRARATRIFRWRSLDGTYRTIADSRFGRSTAGQKVTSHPVHVTGAVSARADHDPRLRAVSRRRRRTRPSRRALAESRAGTPRVRDACACGEEGRRTTKEELASLQPSFSRTVPKNPTAETRTPARGGPRGGPYRGRAMIPLSCRDRWSATAWYVAASS
jgi:hypothetical protein